MRSLIQRVSKTSVQIDNTVVDQIGQGLLILVSAIASDTEKEAQNWYQN